MAFGVGESKLGTFGRRRPGGAALEALPDVGLCAREPLLADEPSHTPHHLLSRLDLNDDGDDDVTQT
jgi:hypothetical protein